ncbi:PAS domain-containing hybrid sensor histidine kinase/response regulator [Palleronia sp. LCG004]|uniref:PAS domain-containing hybrid sensor histidine kinase/response regulator n=1 Tax=Palleronia sp. LCG004 TaxID=3079304 RepID=UPI002943C94D|nr:response regulator [Palleronia sp. LCG004]WOI55492.1 response regulator [Palleronia sp. LCG004]
MRSLNAARSGSFVALVAGFGLCLLVLLSVMSARRYILTTQHGLEISRLFLRLERTIGYDGFIHNFKNAVLRPDEPIYQDRARSDFAEVLYIVETTSRLADELGIPHDLDAVAKTVSEYRSNLDRIQALSLDGLSSAEIDDIVRVSDESAGAAIRGFEAEIEDVLAYRQTRLSVTFIASLISSLLLFAALLTFSFLRRRKLHEYTAAIERHDRILRKAEDLAKLGRWESNLRDRITWSESTHRLLGVEAEEFDGSRDYAWELVHPEDRGQLRRAMRKAVEGDGNFSCVHRMIRPDGKTIIVNDIGEVTYNSIGEVAGFTGTIQDITEIIELEDRLRQAEKVEAIGQLAGGVAHDFNNLLAVILGNLELLIESDKQDDVQRHAKSALEATRKGASLTRSILGFARKSQLHVELTDLNELLRKSNEITSRVLPATISLETALSAGLWSVEVDRDMVDHAILNLIINARDAMPSGGQITIETANIRIDDDYIDSRGEEIEPGRYAMIAVSDTGTGIDPENLRRIFEPFFTTKPPGQGSGVGLAMVMGFMRQSKGTILVYSEVGVGTTFKLYFKTSNGTLAPDVLPEERADATGGRGARVLVVEDEAMVLSTIQETLTKAGFDVVTARSGDEAFSLWGGTSDYDILLTDIVMPGNLQGTHLAKKLREQRPDLPIVFMSGYASEATVHGNGLQSDDGRLTKPVARSELIKTLNATLRKRMNDVPDS